MGLKGLWSSAISMRTPLILCGTAHTYVNASSTSQIKLGAEKGLVLMYLCAELQHRPSSAATVVGCARAESDRCTLLEVARYFKQLFDRSTISIWLADWKDHSPEGGFIPGIHLASINTSNGSHITLLQREYYFILSNAATKDATVR